MQMPSLLRGQSIRCADWRGPADEHTFWGRVAPRIAADLLTLTDPPIRVCVVADDDDPSAAHLELRHPDGYVVPIFVAAGDDEEEAAVVEAFDLVLDSAVFDDTSDPWPRCPSHPTSGHSLAPALRHGVAIWACPNDRRVFATIGSLNSPGA